jgi:hypothetical protein
MIKLHGGLSNFKEKLNYLIENAPWYLKLPPVSQNSYGQQQDGIFQSCLVFQGFSLHLMEKKYSR